MNRTAEGEGNGERRAGPETFVNCFEVGEVETGAGDGLKKEVKR
jgi:hypothetical protein